MKSSLLLVIVLFVVNFAAAESGCCLNPATQPCQFVVDEKECCPPNSTYSKVPESFEDCLTEFFYGSIDETACLYLPEEKVELCQMGCCCPFESNEAPFVARKLNCEAAGGTWKKDTYDCNKNVCSELHQQEIPRVQTTSSTTVRAVTSTTTSMLQRAKKEPTSINTCLDHNGMCRRGFGKGGLMALLGWASWCNPDEKVLEVKGCSVLQRCCIPREFQLNVSNKGNFQLFRKDLYSRAGKKVLSFRADYNGVIFYMLNAENDWFIFNTAFSELALNDLRVAYTKNRLVKGKVKVKKGDTVTLTVNGYNCLAGLLCNGFGYGELVYGAEISKGFGNDLLIGDYVSGFPIGIYTGETSDRPISQCLLMFGDKLIATVVPEQTPDIHYFEQELSGYGKKPVKYICYDKNNNSATAMEGLSYNVECQTDSDCKKPPRQECTGSWRCVFNECVWSCNETFGMEAESTLDKAIKQCLEFCQSEQPNEQAMFFNENPALAKYQTELGITGTRCTAILKDVANCSESFKTEFEKLLDKK